MAPPPSPRYKQAWACLPLCGTLCAFVPDQLCSGLTSQPMAPPPSPLCKSKGHESC